MTDIYLHGIETIEKNDGPRPVATIDTGIIGMIGTAPDADADLWPLNKPVAVFGYNGTPQGLGSNGTLADMISGILDQATRASQTMVIVRVEEGADLNATMSNVIGSDIAKTGMHALLTAKSELNLTPKLLIAPGFTSNRPTDGVASIAITDSGSGYTEPPTVAITGDGFGATATAVINSTTGVVEEIVVTNPGGGYTSATVTLTGGDGADATATATLGTVANPVAVELLSVAKRLRAGVIVDAPNSDATAGVQYRRDFDTDRALIVDTYSKVFKNSDVVTEPSAARVAGLQARVDYDEGFWHSPSNHVVEGIIGTARAVGHSLSDPSAESQYLNRNGVSVIVRAPSGGFKLWGSRVPSSDSLTQFWSVRRSHDTIIDSIEIAHEPFVDKPFSLQALVDIAETVNSALRRWAALGATLGGRVWLDPSINTKETWVSGHLYVSYDAEAPAPMEHITFLFSRNTGYYERLAADAVREIQRISGRIL